jgi:hypothetical protein
MESVRTGASQGAAGTGTLAALEEPETDIEKKQVELEREERVAQQQASDPTAEIVGRLFTSARNSVVLCAQAEQQLPLQEVVLYPPFLPALCHRLAMPQIAVWRLPQYGARETEPGSREKLPASAGAVSDFASHRCEATRSVTESVPSAEGLRLRSPGKHALGAASSFLDRSPAKIALRQIDLLLDIP